MSEAARNLKKAFLMLGDLGAMYFALYFALFLRYGGTAMEERWTLHFWPFTVSFALWLAILYIVGLYDVRRLRNRMTLISLTGEALVASLFVSLALFYLIPSFGVAPKTNLVIAIGLFAMLFTAWRLLTMRVFTSGNLRLRAFFLGRAPETESVMETLRNNPQLGYDIAGIAETMQDAGGLVDADIIVVSHRLDENDALIRSLFSHFVRRTAVIPFPDFHEHLHRSVAESAISEQWILRHVASRDIGLYEVMKRPLDAALAALLSVPALALSPLIALAILLDDGAPILYRQERVGRGGKPFRIVKFRTMRVDAEQGGAAFSTDGDARVTRSGRFLRATRLDELPQLWNILKGEMSFVGPRPERPEMEAALTTEIPLFPIRHLIRPGLTGWAQIHSGYASDVESHRRKLRNDLYYLKHQSFTLDLAIIMQTVYSVLKGKGR